MTFAEKIASDHRCPECGGYMHIGKLATKTIYAFDEFCPLCESKEQRIKLSKEQRIRLLTPQNIL
jgi:Zn finger protein HypA/HybF involved in hydrogenase expression